VLVGVLVVTLLLGAVQLALFMHVKNTLQDAASEGARWAAMADSSLEQGVIRTQELIQIALGEGYAQNVVATQDVWNGHPVVAVTVRATVPLMGLIGVPGALETTGHSAFEVVGP
jgi:Flp pilus assembly protein TadG